SPKPIIETVWYSDPNGSVPDQIQAHVNFNEQGFGSWVTFGTTGHAAGDDYLLSLQVSSAVTATGHYPWEIEVKATFGNDTLTRGLSGYADVVVLNSSESTSGYGWNLAGVDRVISVTGGLLWVFGSGGVKFFESVGLSSRYYASPPDDFGSFESLGGY